MLKKVNLICPHCKEVGAQISMLPHAGSTQEKHCNKCGGKFEYSYRPGDSYPDVYKKR